MFSRSTTIDCTAPSTRPSALESASTPVVTARSASTAAALTRVQLGAHRRRQLRFGAADALLDGVDEPVHLARDIEARGAQLVGELLDLVGGDLIGRAASELAERLAHALEVGERAVLAEQLLRAREPGRGRADRLPVECAPWSCRRAGRRRSRPRPARAANCWWRRDRWRA